MLFSQFAVWGHRGCSSLAPENTRASFYAAKKYGAHGVEIDVMLLGDGTPVLSHDITVDRCSNVSGKVSNFTREQISHLDCGSWFSPKFANESMLTLDDACDLLKTLALDVNLEIKAPHDHAHFTVVEVQKTLKRHPYFGPDNLIISSFDYTTLTCVRKVLPESRIAILYENEIPKNWLTQVRYIQACALHIDVKYARTHTLIPIKEAGLCVCVWVVNTVEDGHLAKSKGAHGIMSDYPQCFTAFVK